MDLDLTPQEIALSVDTVRFPAILTPEQASELLQIAKTTLYRKVSEGAFRSAVRRGKPLRFWRDRLVVVFLRGNPRGQSRRDSS
jgi:excisionase family DNA binding protein